MGRDRYNCTLNSSYFMVVYTVRVIQHEGVELKSSIQHEAQPSAVLQL